MQLPKETMVLEYIPPNYRNIYVGCSSCGEPFVQLEYFDHFDAAGNYVFHEIGFDWNIQRNGIIIYKCNGCFRRLDIINSSEFVVIHPSNLIVLD